MPAKKTDEVRPLRDRAVDAALVIAERDGWDAITFQRLAESCACSLSDLYALFDDRSDIWAAYTRRVDAAVMDRACPDLSEPERDRLFDVMMDRFDVLNDDRAAVISILHAFRRDPKQALCGLPHLGRSMAWMMEAAGLDMTTHRATLRGVGLSAIYLYALKTWIDDDSPDMARTMAALDRALTRAEPLARFF